MVKSVKSGVIIFLGLMFFGCVPPPPRPYDSNNPLKRVAVLPLRNDTADVEGPDIVRKKMIKALEEHSYLVKDVKETDQILRDRMGITLGGQLTLTTAQKLGQELGVEGVLYGTLMDFDESTTGVINVKKVRGTFKLVNTMTGQTVLARGLGIRSEMRMQGNYGTAAAIISRASDARDKEVPWVTIESTSTGSSKVGESFAIGLGTRLLSTAIGLHLDHESSELARRVTYNMPWGPGPGAAATMPAPMPHPVIGVPEVNMPAPPSFGYMEWEGKRDFSAVVYSTNFNKAKSESFTTEMPLAIAGEKFRMEMDLSKTMKEDGTSPLSKMVVIDWRDKKTGYTLYPNSQRYIVHKEDGSIAEKPKVEKTKIGDEVVGKHPTEKFKVRITYKDGKIDEGFIWNASDLGGMTIKSVVENKDYKVTTEVRNIVLKTPAASQFEIPAGYTEAQGFMDLMAPESQKK